LTFIVATLMAFSLVACDKKAEQPNKHSLNLDEGTNPSGLPSSFQGDELSKVMAGLSANATEEQVREAVFVAYNAANRSRKTAENSLMIQYTDGGQLQYKGFELKSGNAWYYQLPTQALGIYDMMEQGNTLVAYTYDSIEFNFVRLGADSKPICEGVENFPYAEFLMIKKPDVYNFDEFKEKRFFLDDQLELCNMKFSLDLIDKTSTITYDSEKDVYTVNLVVDCSQDQEKLAEWYAQAFKEGNTYSPVSVGVRYYDYWKAKIEIWGNGYVKFLRYDEKWTSDKEIFGIKIGSESYSEFKFFYDESEIFEFLQQDKKYKNLSEDEQSVMTTLESYIEMYSGAEIVSPALKSWETALIVIGCVLFAVIAVVVGVEVAVKCGKLPKLAAKREAQKQKRLAKIEAKRQAKLGIQQDSADFEILDQEAPDNQESNDKNE